MVSSTIPLAMVTVAGHGVMDVRSDKGRAGNIDKAGLQGKAIVVVAGSDGTGRVPCADTIPGCVVRDGAACYY